MDLLNQFLPRSDFSSYDDFCKGFELNFPDDFNFAYDVVDFYAVHSPEQRALVWCNDLGQSKEFTFKQISDLSFIAAAFLMEQGIGPKDVVILSLHRHYEYWIFLLALHRLGAVAFPLSSQLTKDEVLSRKEYCKAKGKNLKIELEVRNFDELQQALDEGVDRIMFDNFTPEDTKKAVEIVAGRCETESSGGITYETMLPYAQAGVDFISFGALTHSVKGMDMSFKAC